MQDMLLAIWHQDFEQLIQLQAVGLLVTCLVVILFLESSFVFLPLPGDSLVLLAGGLVGMGVLGPEVVFLYLPLAAGVGSDGQMAAVITAVVMAGRTGAAFAAELASMKANEEIDALEVLGIQPVAYLVVPRVLALLLMLPLLYGFACVAGLAGGYAVSASLLDLPPVVYTNRSIEALSLAHLGLGFSKCFAFGLLVALAGCHHGLQADRDAAGVGQATTRAVVAGIVGVIAIDAVFAVCANALGV